MKYIMKKLTLLACVTIITTILSVLTTPIGLYAMVAVNEVINGACLILSFAFCDIYYRKLYCLFLFCFK
eukprot:UN03792